MGSLPESLDAAPFGFVEADGEGRATLVNRVADAMGVCVGALLGDIFDGFDVVSAVEGASIDTQLTVQGKQRPCRLLIERQGESLLVWIVDVAETRALAAQLRRLKRPQNQRIRWMGHQAVTGLGYAELLSVILEQDLGIGQEKQDRLRHYQEEVVKTLRNIHQAVAEPHPKWDVETKLNLVVADGVEELTELLVELLRAKGYRVTGYSSGESVIKALQLNGANVIAVVDENLRSGDATLPELIDQRFPSVRLVRLSTAPGSAPGCAVKKPVDFDELLTTIREVAESG